MTTLLIILLIYLALGLMAMARGIYLRWRTGDDILVEDVGPLLFLWIMWPLAFVMVMVDMVDEKLQERNGVLLRGSKSAKVERALRK